MSRRMTKSNARESGSTVPNFVFILADDLGYSDLRCYGGREDCSPNLDKKATEGLLLTNGYANSSVCSPSRFAIATGRYQHRQRGGFDEPIASVLPAFGSAAGTSDDGFGFARRGLRHRARWEMASGFVALV